MIKTIEISDIEKEIAGIQKGKKKFKQIRKQESLKKGNQTVWVDEYVGPRGAGYIINIEKKGKIKTIDKGPEGRSHDWRDITPKE